MPFKRHRIAMRIAMSLVAVLLVPTLATPALAQAERQAQKAPARMASERDVLPAPSALPITDLEVATQANPDLEDESISLARPEAAILFPSTGTPAESDSEAAKAPAAAVALSTTAWIVIAVAAAAAAAVLIFVEPG